MIQIEPYTNVLRKGVFDFTERCFSELGKRFEPIGRHSFYNDIENEFGIINQYGGISTYFYPDEGSVYWFDQVSKYA